MGYFSLMKLGVQTCRVTRFDDQFLYSKQWLRVVDSYLYINFVSKNETASFQILKSNFLIRYFLFKSFEKFFKSLHLPFRIMKVNMTWTWYQSPPPPSPPKTTPLFLAKPLQPPPLNVFWVRIYSQMFNTKY